MGDDFQFDKLPLHRNDERWEEIESQYGLHIGEILVLKKIYCVKQEIIAQPIQPKIQVGFYFLINGKLFLL